MTENGEHSESAGDESATTAEGGTDDERTKTYSFACSPVERVMLLVAMVVSPIAVVRTLVGLRDTAQSTGVSLNELLAISNARLTVGMILLLTLFILVFCPLYVQYRSRTRLVLEQKGLAFRRETFLPFSFLTRDIHLEWQQVDEIRYRYRVLPLPIPLFELRYGDRWLRLPISQLWDTSDGERRPWKTPVPKDGWSEHPAVKYAQDRFVASRASLAAEAASASESD